MTIPFNELLIEAADLAKRGGSADDLATTAVELARHVRQAQDALEPLKTLIRDLARSERKDGQHHIGYPVSNGRVSVTFPERRYEARRDVDWDKARDDLGADFKTFFRESTTVRTQTAIEDLLIAEMERAQDSNAETLLQYIEMDEPIPRVGFKPA
jgi:hypothetical protein